ncbi:MAG: hypothetical protein ACLR0U_01275 [Enterocloster clostridioformis]
MWKRMFAMDGVVYNKLLGMAGIQTSFSWLETPGQAAWVSHTYTKFGLAVWFHPCLSSSSSPKQVPAVPMYGAAEVDGASAPAKFFR